MGVLRQLRVEAVDLDQTDRRRKTDAPVRHATHDVPSRVAIVSRTYDMASRVSTPSSLPRRHVEFTFVRLELQVSYIDTGLVIEADADGEVVASWTDVWNQAYRAVAWGTLSGEYIVS